jgi:hypothetical protein
VAEEIGYTPDEVKTIHPGLPIAAFDGLFGDDFLDCVFRLERRLGQKIDPNSLHTDVTPVTTVGELCERIAQGVSIPVIVPVRVLGQPCLAAGAFLTVQRLLADDGADVSAVGPSTPLTDHLLRRSLKFDATLRLLAADRLLPPLRRKNLRLSGLRCVMALSLWVSVLSFFVVGSALLRAGWPGSDIAAAVSGVFLVIGLVAMALTRWADRRENWSVEFGGLYDFRDLVDTTLGRPLRRRATAQPLEPAP